MIEQGFYIISDEFFKQFPDPYLKGNKNEKRPHCYAILDPKTGLYWMIPMSSRVDKYRSIMEKREQSGKPCDILHIAKLDNSKESVFLIQDIFPVSDEYIARKYTINGNHLRITSENLAKLIVQKSRRTIGLLRRGIKFTFTQADVLKIEKQLIKQKSR